MVKMRRAVFITSAYALLTLVLCSCSHTIGRFELLYVEPMPADGLVVTQTTEPIKSHPESCVSYITVVPTSLTFDLPRIVREAGPGQLLSRPQFQRKWWMVPLVYGH